MDKNIEIGCNLGYNLFVKTFDIGLDIKRFIELFELSQEEYAGEVGLSRMQIYRLINSIDRPSKETLEKIYGYAYKQGVSINKSKESLFIDNKKDRVLLFHGATSDIIGDVDTKHSVPPNDFGDGFYLGETLNQAATWVANSNNASVYSFYLNKKNYKTAKFYVDREWLYAILYYRNAFKNFELTEEVLDIIKKVEEADIVIAPIADNQMYQTIDSFARNEITDEACIHALSATNLGLQYVLKNDNVCKELTFIDRLYLCQREKDDYLSLRNIMSKEGIEKARLSLFEYRREGKYFDEIFKRK